MRNAYTVHLLLSMPHLAVCDLAMRIRHHFQKLHDIFVLEGAQYTNFPY